MRKIIFCLVVFCCAFLSAQENEEVFKNPTNELFLGSPELTAFQKHNFMTPSLYTGKVDVKIPIYEIEFSGIKIPVTLDYDTGGTKVDEIASSVGLGWSLNAGGNIAVVVKDIPDGKMVVKEYGDGWHDPYFYNYYHVRSLGYHRRIYDYDLIGQDIDDDSYWGVNIDASPDIFNIVAPSMNGKFIVLSDDPDVNTLAGRGEHNLYNREFKSYFLENKGYKIDDSELFYTTYNAPNILGSDLSVYPPSEYLEYIKSLHEAKYIDHFTITNTNGLVYEFKIGDVVENNGVGYYDGDSDLSGNYTKSVNSYNLHSITDPITKDKVEFIYEDYEYDEPEVTASLRYQFNFTDRHFEYWTYNALVAGNPVFQQVFPRKTRIKSIKFAEGEVEFTYDTNKRLDYNDNALSKIKVKDYNGIEIKSFGLSYDYFKSKENCNDYVCNRLKLNEISINNNGDVLNRYKLEYNEATQLPMRRFSFEKDYLGYYNKNEQGYFAESTGNSRGDLMDVQNKYLRNYPKLYFYPNQEELSILPFKRKDLTSSNSFVDFGKDYSSVNIDLEPNFEGSLATSLKKINYPTGGSLELEYENHEFYYEGHSYIAPGLRVKKQILDNGKGKKEEYRYAYEDSLGNSSGYFNSMPVFANINTKNIMQKNSNRFALDFHLDPQYGLELTHGSFIGYSEVKETQLGNGYKTYYYHSPK